MVGSPLRLTVSVCLADVLPFVNFSNRKLTYVFGSKICEKCEQKEVSKHVFNCKVNFLSIKIGNYAKGQIYPGCWSHSQSSLMYSSTID